VNKGTSSSPTWRLWILALLVSVDFCGASPTPSEPRIQRPGSGLPGSNQPNRALNQYLVTITPGGGEADIRAAFGSFGIKEIKLVTGRTFLVKIERDPGPEEFSKTAQSARGIEAVQPDYIYHIN